MVSPLPVVASKRTLTTAICNALIQRYTRAELESVLPEELRLDWRRAGAAEPGQAETKRDLITGYIQDWSITRLVSLAQQLSTYAEICKLNQEQLASLAKAYEQGDGVQGSTNNLIFASTGPKPDLVLRDAVSNDIEVIANGDTCLIYDQPLPAGGLKFSDLVAWWAAHASCPSVLDTRASRGTSISGWSRRSRTHQRFCCSGPTTHASGTTRTSLRLCRRSISTTTRSTSELAGHP